MKTTVGRTVLEVATGDIAALDVAAIANAANSELWMGSGVAGAIKRAGGVEIEREAMRQGPIAVGDAVATAGGALRATWVIHAAVMGHDLRTSADLIAAATTRTLEVAGRLGARSLGLPAFGTGVGGFPIYSCAEIMIERVHAYLAEGGSSLRRIVFCAHDEVGAAAFKHALSGAKRLDA
jgi:O-acetyl-ADP-ribose deacetylase (regulator of RNase III)